MAQVRNDQTQGGHEPRSGRIERPADFDALFARQTVFWQGTSGYAYVHTVYSLTGCPPLPPASVLFVRTVEGAGRMVLDVCSVSDAAPTLNLAEVRQRGALLGANEVHVHFAVPDRRARQSAVADLRTRYVGCNAGGLQPIGR